MTSISIDKQEEKIYSQREVDELYKKWIHGLQFDVGW